MSPAEVERVLARYPLTRTPDRPGVVVLDCAGVSSRVSIDMEAAFGGPPTETIPEVRGLFAVAALMVEAAALPPSVVDIASADVPERGRIHWLEQRGIVVTRSVVVPVIEAPEWARDGAAMREGQEISG